MFYICTIVMLFTVLQCVNKDIIYIYIYAHYRVSGLKKNRRAKLGQIQGGLQRAIQDSTKGGLQ